MSYLFDSDLCIGLLHGRDPGLTEKFSRIPVLECLTSVIVEAELWVGVEKRKASASVKEHLTRFLDRFTVLPVDREVARRYSEIRVDQEANGLRIGNNDLLIAATASVHGLVLATRNVREYGRIRGLKLETLES